MANVVGLPTGQQAFGQHYQRRQPKQTQLYQLVEQYYPPFRDLMAEQGRRLPEYVQEELDAFLKSGRLEHGFKRVRCGTCQHERLVAFSCKKCGWCPSCGASRMADSAAHLTDEVLAPEAGTVVTLHHTPGSERAASLNDY